VERDLQPGHSINPPASDLAGKGLLPASSRILGPSVCWAGGAPPAPALAAGPSPGGGGYAVLFPPASDRGFKRGGSGAGPKKYHLFPGDWLSLPTYRSQPPPAGGGGNFATRVRGNGGSGWLRLGLAGNRGYRLVNGTSHNSATLEVKGKARFFASGRLMFGGGLGQSDHDDSGHGSSKNGPSTGGIKNSLHGRTSTSALGGESEGDRAKGAGAPGAREPSAWPPRRARPANGPGLPPKRAGAR